MDELELTEDGRLLWAGDLLFRVMEVEPEPGEVKAIMVLNHKGKQITRSAILAPS